MVRNKPAADRSLGLSEHRQISLPVHLRDDATFENYLPAESSAAVLHALRQLHEPAGESLVFLHGPTGSGKSHLLQASCHLAGTKALYLPLAELRDYPPAEVLAGIEEMALVCLDDLQAVVGRDDWELALFNLYNRVREADCRLLIAADTAPRVMPIALADLRSRLAWGVVYHLPSADDDGKRAILQFRANTRGLALVDDVARYIVSRASRDLARLLAVLDILDQASLEQQRSLSIPFVKKTLGW